MRRASMFSASPLPLAGGAGGGRVRPTGPPLTPPASGRGTVALLAALATLWTAPLAAREAVEASAPTALAVTLYRDPDRDQGDEMDGDWPEGFGMITETRTVTLPPGESTIRFTGVAEGMVAVSAIVTGLPGGTIEKNRNAELLSPASLVDGTLGNRVTVTRTNPATGAAVAVSAVIRTRADGGLVLETGEGFEAVRCSGLPETLTFDRVPAGLSAQPVFSVDTRDPRGGTYTVQLSYLAWGFDWQAHYVATLAETGTSNDVRLRLTSWLTLLNDNGQSFPDAELLVIAGTLNIASDFEELGDEPSAPPLQLTCYPLGNTARGSDERSVLSLNQSRDEYDEDLEAVIVVTGYRAAPAPPVMIATEEALGDLKLYRVPEPVTVAAKGLKQVAFLDRDDVKARLLYSASCEPGDDDDGANPADILLATVNDRQHGLGVALPMGAITVFEPSSAGDMFVGEEWLRDYAAGQDVEVPFGESSQVFMQCELTGGEDPDDNPGRWTAMRAVLTNANPGPVSFRVGLGWLSNYDLRGFRNTRLKDGQTIVEVTVPANGRREVSWEVRRAAEEEEDEEA